MEAQARMKVRGDVLVCTYIMIGAGRLEEEAPSVIEWREALHSCTIRMVSLCHTAAQEALRQVSAGLSSGAQAAAAAGPAVGEQWDEEGNPLPPPDPRVDKVAGIDWDRVDRTPVSAAAATAPAGQRQQQQQEGAHSGVAGSVDTGREKWWQRRFQVQRVDF
jgi:hypothetical protein